MIINAAGIAILLCSFAVLIVLKVPITFSLAASSILTAIYLDIPLNMIAQRMVNGLQSTSLMAIPFFILAGQIMGAGSISTRLISFANSIVGCVKGGLAMVNVLASMLFGGMSGSSVADSSSIGSILIPAMEKEGYDKEFATSLTIAASTQGVLIPPSHNMIIYSMAAGGLSVSSLFLAGYIPGILLGISFMVVSYIFATINNYPRSCNFSVRNIFKSFKESFFALLTILIILGGVLSGVFTATESAAVAAVYAFFISYFFYRDITAKDTVKILLDSLKTVGMVFALIATSNAFGWLLAYLKVPAIVTQTLLGISDSPTVIMLIINGVLLFLGCIMDMAPLIVIVTPILLPVVTAIGVSPIHFGIILLLSLCIGLLTPPVGSTLFVGAALSGLSIERLSRALVPFYITMIAVLMLLTYIPSIVMFLPNIVK